MGAEMGGSNGGPERGLASHPTWGSCSVPSPLQPCSSAGGWRGRWESWLQAPNPFGPAIPLPLSLSLHLAGGPWGSGSGLLGGSGCDLSPTTGFQGPSGYKGDQGEVGKDGEKVQWVPAGLAGPGASGAGGAASSGGGSCREGTGVWLGLRPVAVSEQVLAVW